MDSGMDSTTARMDSGIMDSTGERCSEDESILFRGVNRLAVMSQ